MLPCISAFPRQPWCASRHPLGSHAALHSAFPRQPCCPSRHPLGSHAALHSASPRQPLGIRQPCCAPRQPNSAPRQPLGSMLRAPRHPLGNHALHLGIPALHLGNPSRPLGSHTLASLKRLPQAHSPPYIYKCWHAHLARGSPMFHKN